LNSSVVILDRTDSTGIRFYLGNELRQHDLGHLTLGVDSSAIGIAVPPRADRFIVDTYCTANATSVSTSQFFCGRMHSVTFCMESLNQGLQLLLHFHILIYKVESLFI
jgi:hypothetical protein